MSMAGDWWVQLFDYMLGISLDNLMRIEEAQDGSIEAATLLMEAADNYNFLQQAYHEKCGGDIHVDFFICD